jgi:hypothetical protein
MIALIGNSLAAHFPASPSGLMPTVDAEEIVKVSLHHDEFPQHIGTLEPLHHYLF